MPTTTAVRLTHKVCVLQPEEARMLEHSGTLYRCSASRHPHYRRNKVEQLVKDGKARWVGRGKNKVELIDPREWQKVYARNHDGETISATLQWIPGAGLL